MNTQVIKPTQPILDSLGELGMEVPEGATIVAAQDTPGVMNIVIPKAPGVMALGDNDLDGVAGGTTQGGYVVPGMAVLGPFLDQYSAAQAAAFNTLTSAVQQAQSWIQDAQNG